MKIIRWSALVPTVLIVGLAAVFTLFFMDGVVKEIIEKAGTAANGAKVELGGVNISLRKMSVTLKRLQVTDEAAPMTNSLDVDSLVFDLAAKPLAWKKIVIEKAAITGIRTGTPRASSGAIPKDEKKSEEKKPEDQTPSLLAEKGKEVAQFALANLREQYDPKDMVRLENLDSYRKIQEEQTRLTDLSKTWEDKTNALDVQSRAQAAKALADRVKTEKFQGLEGIQKAKSALDEAKKVKDDLEEAQKSFNGLRDSLKKEMAQTKEGLKQIDELRKQDAENALAPLKAGFSTEGITKGLVGPSWQAKIQTYLGYFHKIRKMMPQKKAGEKTKTERKGRDIAFPFHYNWPLFHLKAADISGTTAGESPLDYRGTLKDVASDPVLVGRPIVLDISGKKQGGPEALALRAELDYTKDNPREKVSVKYAGLALAGTPLGKVGGPVTIAEGNGVATADIEVKGETLSGTIQFNANPVKLEQTLTPEQTNRLTSLLREVLVKINTLDITLLLSDTLLSPNVKIQTSLDDQISKAVKAALQKQLDEIKAEVRKRVDDLVAAEKQKLLDLVNKKTGLTMDSLNNKENVLKNGRDQVQKIMDDLKGETKPALPDFKNIFKKK